jgi:hypothetical protein
MHNSFAQQMCPRTPCRNFGQYFANSRMRRANPVREHTAWTRKAQLNTDVLTTYNDGSEFGVQKRTN